MNKCSIFPKSLKKGDQIAVISPAGAVVAPQLEQTLKLIESHGYKTVLGKHLYTEYKNGYTYAGTEKQRLFDLNWALNHERVSAIWASRGGYGCQHLVGHFDLKYFRKNPKWYIGYSDNTVLQSYLFKKKIASIYGQTIKTSSFGVSENSYQFIFDCLKGDFPKYNLSEHEMNRTGKATGKLVGGNLALVYALLGTKYAFDFKENILFIEDIGENFYALDRMLMSLELAGAFNQINALIVGGMTNMGNEADNPKYNESFDVFAYQLVQSRVAKYQFPVAYAFPNGHIFENWPLIIGAEVELKVGKKTEIKFLG